jgi:pimeloyl-ACP methyl ester carboxylesterase
VVGVVANFQCLGSQWPFEIQSIQSQTTIWHGYEDRTCGIAIAEYFLNNIPNSTAHLLEDKGHFFIFEKWRDILEDIKINTGKPAPK